MRTSAVAAAAALAACGSSRPPASNTNDPSIDWSQVSDQAHAMAAWRQLAPTGGDRDDVVQAIPVAARRAMAFALVRDGSFTCSRIVDECGEPTTDAPRDDEGIDAPCLREELLGRMFAGDEETAPIPEDVIAAVARTGSADLARWLGQRLPTEDLLRMLAAMQGRADAAGWFAWELAPDDLARAVTEYHLGGAVSDLDRGTQQDVLIAAVGDEELGPHGQLAAIRTLFGGYGPPVPPTDALVADLVELADAPSCQLASAAAHGLAVLGHPEHLPARPATEDPAAVLRALCVLAHSDTVTYDDQPLLATFLGDRGLEVLYPQGVPFEDDTSPSRLQLASDDAEAWFAVIPPQSDGVCTGTTCLVDGGRVDYTLAPAADGDLRLTRIVYRRDLDGEAAARAAAASCEPAFEGD